MHKRKLKEVDITFAQLVGTTDECLREARYGGDLVLDDGRVGAFAGPEGQLIGWIASERVLRHLKAGGIGYFRSSDDLDRNSMMCTLFE